VILSFADKATEDLFNGSSSKAARHALPIGLWRHARRKLDRLNTVKILGELETPPGNRLEALFGDRAGQYSIRINQRYRVCFRWTEAGPAHVGIVDYH
jgi:proteic killer suppression protein